MQYDKKRIRIQILVANPRFCKHISIRFHSIEQQKKRQTQVLSNNVFNTNNIKLSTNLQNRTKICEKKKWGNFYFPQSLNKSTTRSSVRDIR